MSPTPHEPEEWEKPDPQNRPPCPAFPPVDDLSTPVMIIDPKGWVLAWNQAFLTAMDLPTATFAPHLVRQDLLDEPRATLAHMTKVAGNGGQTRLRMRTLHGDPRDFLASLRLLPDQQNKKNIFLLALMVDATESAQSEAALRRELHHLEELLALEPGERSDHSWQETAADLLALAPGPAVILNRDLQVILPRQEKDGPPVLCGVHLLGSPGRCPDCLAARALATGREQSGTIDGVTLKARPLTGGLVVEWKEP